MLVNKRITVANENLLRFMFPRYELVSEKDINRDIIKPVIYKGDYSLADNMIEKCREKNLDYIILGAFSDINLEDRRILANIIFEKWRNGVLPAYLDKIIDNIDKNEFIEHAKIKWVTGKWKITKIENEDGFLQLIDDLNKSKYDFIKTYFNVLNDKPYKLESSMLTFLQRAKTKSYQGTSFNYKKKLDMYNGTKLERTLDGINESLEYNIDNPELRLLNLFINIQDSNKNS